MAGSKSKRCSRLDSTWLFHRGRKGRYEPQSHTIRLRQPGPETASDPQVLELTAPLRAAADTYLNIAKLLAVAGGSLGHWGTGFCIRASRTRA